MRPRNNPCTSTARDSTQREVSVGLAPTGPTTDPLPKPAPDFLPAPTGLVPAERVNRRAERQSRGFRRDKPGGEPLECVMVLG